MCPNASTVNGTNTGTGACTFARKLCVTCTSNPDDNNITYIRVQTNDAPDFCYHSGVFAPNPAWMIDYMVPWNQNITSPRWNIGTNYTEFEGIVCTKNYTMEIWIDKLTNFIDYPMPGPGITLAGSLIAPGLSGDGYDAFNTTVYGPIANETMLLDRLPTQFDRCMTHIDGNGFVHNHMLPGCTNAGNPVFAATSG
jgi:hypothetical protein